MGYTPYLINFIFHPGSHYSQTLYVPQSEEALITMSSKEESIFFALSISLGSVTVSFSGSGLESQEGLIAICGIANLRDQDIKFKSLRVGAY